MEVVAKDNEYNLMAKNEGRRVIKELSREIEAMEVDKRELEREIDELREKKGRNSVINGNDELMGKIHLL